MIALDTNVVVRVLTNDDPDQARRGADLLTREAVHLGPTVLLEAEWVLRHAYGLGRGAISQAFRKLLGLPRVTAGEPAVVAQALGWYDEGLDFAGALHLAGAREAGAAALASFDRESARRAARLCEIPVREP